MNFNSQDEDLLEDDNNNYNSPRTGPPLDINSQENPSKQLRQIEIKTMIQPSQSNQYQQRQARRNQQRKQRKENYEHEDESPINELLLNNDQLIQLDGQNMKEVYNSEDQNPIMSQEEINHNNISSPFHGTDSLNNRSIFSPNRFYL